MSRKLKECIEFGHLVRRLRAKRGYSQESFAEKADVHRTYIGGIERGERNPTLTMIYRLARALQTSPAQLIKSK